MGALTAIEYPLYEIIIAAALGSLLGSAQSYLKERAHIKSVVVFLFEQAILVAAAILAAIFLVGATSARVAFVVGIAVPIVFRTLGQDKIESRRAAELRHSLQKAEAAVEKEPEKARPVWELSRAHLELYINRNLAQVKQIFWITIAVMAAGFGMVVYGIYRAYDNQLQVAVLTAASGIITQTIGATFLLIYRSTIRQANDYVGTLERINAVGMAVAIVDVIPDEHKELKNKARVDLVKQILAVQRQSSHEVK